MTIAVARFLVVTFTWHESSKVNELTPIFDTALDWLRLSPNFWILWTNSELEVWRGAIQPHLGTGDGFIIGELNLGFPGINYTGWYERWIWDWIDKHRS